MLSRQPDNQTQIPSGMGWDESESDSMEGAIVPMSIEDKFSPIAGLHACGGDERVGVCLRDRVTSTKSFYNFHQPFILVGRHDASDVRIPHPLIGRRQLYLQLIDGKWFVLALSSQIPCQWGNETRTFGWINPRDRIEMGPFSVEVIEGIKEVSLHEQTFNPLVSDPQNKMPSLILENRSGEGVRFAALVQRPLTLVGSGDACKLQIRSGQISSIHCSLVRTIKGYWVNDLGGSGGIRVNSKPCRTALLIRGDILELGGIEFHVRYESPSSLPITSNPTQKTMTEIVLDSSQSVIPPSSLGLQAIPPNGIATIERNGDAILDRYEEHQERTVEQFQGLFRELFQLFGNMMNEQAEMFRNEMSKYQNLSNEIKELKELLISRLNPGMFPEKALGDTPKEVKPPKPRMTQEPSENNESERQIHALLQSRILELQEHKATFWERFLKAFRGEPKNKPQE